jgi:hypothetical protein
MKDYGRYNETGPSGTTQIYLTFVFDFLGVKKNRKNLELLLLCLIVDFVPIYHSLTEILIVFSQDIKKKFGYTLYTIDQNPVEWLIKSLFKGSWSLQQNNILFLVFALHLLLFLL